jgi:hypothetical protein
MNRHDILDFWVMAQKKLLPEETCNYVPQIVAAASKRCGMRPHEGKFAKILKKLLRFGSRVDNFLKIYVIIVVIILYRRPRRQRMILVGSRIREQTFQNRFLTAVAEITA